MAEKLFDSNLVRRRGVPGQWAPVRDEISARLRERVAEVRLDMAKVCWLRQEVLEQDFCLPDAPYDAVIVDGFLPLVPDVPVVLLRCLQALREDGFLLGWMLGSESFREFRAAWACVDEGPDAHVIPFTDVKSAGALLHRLKVALPVVDRDIITVTFSGFEPLYAALRAHGVANFSTRRCSGLTSPARLRAMEQAYLQLFPREDGRVPVTLEIVYLHGFRPAPGQPSALKPGSGRVSLVRILEQDSLQEVTDSASSSASSG